MIAADLIVVGCVAKKGTLPAPARYLYQGNLWRHRMAYADATGVPWLIFSAWYGLISPEMEIEPYDVTFTGERRGAFRSIQSGNAAKSIARMQVQIVEIHAGADYTADLVPMLVRRGIEVRQPLACLGIGEQMHWYAERTKALRSASEGTSQLRLFGGES